MATNLETGRLAWISDEIRDFERSHALQEIENQTQVERGYRLFFTIMKSVPGISTEPYWERGVEMIELPELFSKTRKAEIHWIEKLVGHTGTLKWEFLLKMTPQTNTKILLTEKLLLY